MSKAKLSSKQRAQSASKMNSSTQSLLSPRRKYSSSSSSSAQFLSTGFYNNWLFYYAILNQGQNNKRSSVNYQLNMLKQQMKHNEELYTVTVKTKQGKRVIVLPKKEYDKIQKGDKVKIKNGVVQSS